MRQVRNSHTIGGLCLNEDNLGVADPFEKYMVWSDDLAVGSLSPNSHQRFMTDNQRNNPILRTASAQKLSADSIGKSGLHGRFSPRTSGDKLWFSDLASIDSTSTIADERVGRPVRGMRPFGQSLVA